MIEILNWVFQNCRKSKRETKMKKKYKKKIKNAMEINFDGLRKRLTDGFNRLVDLAQFCHKESFNTDDYDFDGSEFREAISDIREYVVLLNCLQQEDEDGFNSLSELIVKGLENE